jgi:hypothetical protein
MKIGQQECYVFATISQIKNVEGSQYNLNYNKLGKFKEQNYSTLRKQPTSCSNRR